jgi:hypothetical protein
MREVVQEGVQEIVKKLVTHEDPYYIHKGLGILCLTNYFAQYYFYFVHNTFYLTIYTISPHILLHLSSFIFSVLKKRPVESRLNMFIWEELRIHSLLFAWRSCFSILFSDWSPVICFLTMITADVVTHYHGNLNVSTVRGQHSKVGSRTIVKEISGAFFSMSQFGATYICFTSSHPIIIFSTLPPIQTSAFGMTLIRKNLINKTAWSIVYSGQLLMTYYFWYREYNNINIFFISAVLYLVRRFGTSKYLIWFGLALVNYLVYLIESE